MGTPSKDQEPQIVLQPRRSGDEERDGDHSHDAPQYRTYKRRYFGLITLVLLNVVVSWDWLTFSAVSTTSAEFFDVSEGAINWLSTGYLFAFVAISPVTMWTLNKGGPKASIITAAVLILIGNWIRYAGTRASGGHYGVVLFGQIIIGTAQPFCLTAPTRYSDMWFSDKGRVTATAVASLANPLGGALGQLIGPIWATQVSGIPNMLLYTSILSSVAALPAFFIPKSPPTPPSASSTAPRLQFRSSFAALSSNTSFYLILVPFAIFVGFFNSFSSLINQVLSPYGFSETEAGIAGGILIIVGLIAGVIVSPVIDRTKAYLITIKILIPLAAVGYLIMVFAPGTRSVAAVYVTCAIIGIASFSLLPCALEYLVEITHPVSPEISSTVCWAAGQLLGAIFLIIQGSMKNGWPNQPTGNLKSALVFEAVFCWAAVPLPLLLGWIGTTRTELGRQENAPVQSKRAAARTQKHLRLPSRPTGTPGTMDGGMQDGPAES